MANDLVENSLPTLFCLSPLPGETPSKLAWREARFRRIRVANEAVAAYMRTSGSTNYQSAFMHVQRTRPELFIRAC